MSKHLEVSQQHVIRRLLEMPDLSEVVQSLEPAILHRLIHRCGLEDSGEIIALATTSQLERIFDHDLWRSKQAGAQEQFDAERFGLWLQVLAELGAETAARRLAEMDFDFLTAALSKHILVLESAALVTPWTAACLGMDDYDPMDEERVSETEDALQNSLRQEIGGFTVISKDEESWDALVSILTCLDGEHHAFFGRLMNRCLYISTEFIQENGGLYEVLTAGEQVMSDAADDRERRREREGYVTPAMAVAFLKGARQSPGHGPPRGDDHVTAAYFLNLAKHADASAAVKTDETETRSRAIEQQVAEFIAVLREEEVIPVSRRLLAGEGSTSSGSDLHHVRPQLTFVREQSETAYARRMQELGYLANVLMAGCSFQSRQFREVEAADAVLATCNLGLENWPRTRGCAVLPRNFLLNQDLVSVFKLGWSLLFENVSLHTARRLVELTSALECRDTEVQGELADLCRRLAAQIDAGTPWRERDRLDVIAILDQPSWAVLTALLDECPVLPRHAGERGDQGPLRISTAFDFISGNQQIEWAHRFVESLPAQLAG
jgi:hypothetical protein